MSGIRSCLRTGQRLVVDTQILKWAAIHEMDDSLGQEAWKVLDHVLRVCPVVYMDPRQRNEIVPLFRREVGRSLAKTEFFRKLDEADKTRKVPRSKSKSKPLDEETIKFLKSIKSKSDFFLFETARILDKVLLTADGKLLENRAELKKLTGVEVLGYEDVLPEVRDA